MATSRLRRTFRVPIDESYSDDEVLDEEGNHEYPRPARQQERANVCLEQDKVITRLREEDARTNENLKVPNEG